MERDPVPTRRGRWFAKLFRLLRVARWRAWRDARRAEAGERPVFDAETGEYREFDTVIYHDQRVRGPIPGELACPSSFVIYSSAAEWRYSCVGFDPDQPLGAIARRNGRDLASLASCAAGCDKSVTEVWSGWKCEWAWGFGLSWSAVAVELVISCQADA